VFGRVGSDVGKAADADDDGAVAGRAVLDRLAEV
jgi:hypothetical protein